MRWTKNCVLFLIVLWLVGACIKQPEYSIVPHIDLVDVTFKRGNINTHIPDTLIFKLKFTDGDGDLGISNYDSFYVNSYNPWYFAYNTTTLAISPPIIDNTVTLNKGISWINYFCKRKLPQFDTLPALGCGSWELLKDAKGLTKDTVYIKQNLKAYNTNLDVYIKNGSVYEKFNPTTYFDDGTLTGCAPNIFHATFPNLSNTRKSALDGTITFRLQSFYFYYLFSNKMLKMELTINDRAFHVSNVAAKQDFTLAQITKGG